MEFTIITLDLQKRKWNLTAFSFFHFRLWELFHGIEINPLFRYKFLKTNA